MSGPAPEAGDQELNVGFTFNPPGRQTMNRYTKCSFRIEIYSVKGMGGALGWLVRPAWQILSEKMTQLGELKVKEEPVHRVKEIISQTCEKQVEM